MASPQTENGYIRIANEIWDEVIRRDFTKRQKDILFFIWRLSYGCQKREAYVPQMKSFELCGVSRTKIKDELLYLQNCRVLFWDKDHKLFEINKDYENWYISLVKSWDEYEFQELVASNLIHQQLPKRELNIPKKGIADSQKGNIEFPKKELIIPEKAIEECDEPNAGKASEASKDIKTTKDSIKDINNSCCSSGGPVAGEILHGQIETETKKDTALAGADTDSDRKVPVTEYRQLVANKYLQRSGKGFEISPKDDLVINKFISEKIPLRIVLDGIDQSFNEFKPAYDGDEIRSLNYCLPIVRSLHAKQKQNTAVVPDTVLDTAEDQNQQEYTDDDVQNWLNKLKSTRGEGG